jgi:hypothetical protein
VVVSPLTTLSTSTPEISVVAAVTVNPLSWYVGVRSLSLTKRHTKALARAASNDGTINERIMVGYKNNNQKWSKTSKVVKNNRPKQWTTPSGRVDHCNNHNVPAWAVTSTATLLVNAMSLTLATVVWQSVVPKAMRSEEVKALPDKVNCVTTYNPTCAGLRVSRETTVTVSLFPLKA